MDVILAEHMGFCFGVRRAQEMIEAAAREHGSVSTLGPLVHNRQVTEQLSQSGVRVARSLDEVTEPVVAVSAHGTAPSTSIEAERRGLHLVDGTCPFVRKAQEAARDLVDAGFAVVLFGDPNHTEVKGILGWCGGKTIVVSEPAGLPARQPGSKIGIVSQTTQNAANLQALVAAVVAKWFPRLTELRVVNTICYASVHRQQAAEDLARTVDAMVVIGGSDSANTARLREVCSRTGTPTFQVEDYEDLRVEWFAGRRVVGVTAGASTPDWVIARVTARIQEFS
jgi:small subunit ribosomal protein S1